MPVRSPALVVAAAALVVIVGVDAALDRTLALDVREEGGWRTLATQGGEAPSYFQPYRESTVSASRNDSLEFRVRLDNGYPWAFDEAFRVLESGSIVAEGRLTAPAGGEGSATFTVPASRFYRDNVEPGAPGPRLGHGDLRIETGGTAFHVSVTVQEGPR